MSLDAQHAFCQEVFAEWLEEPCDTVALFKRTVCPCSPGPHSCQPTHCQQASEACAIPRDPTRDAFVEDIAAQVALFASLACCDTVRLRLDVIQGDACRRWHRDCVPLRLICTYRGPATQWVGPELASAVMSAPDDDSQHAQSLATGDVALFKGCGWPGLAHDGGIVHRSPRIGGTGQARLVLVIDAPMRYPAGVGQETAPDVDLLLLS